MAHVYSIALIGMGPRGLSVVERLCANAWATGRRVRLHVVDPWPAGGRVWRTDQSAELLMNTVASQVTVFTDASVRCAGPVVPGPSLYEWARTHAPGRCPGPDDYPARALFGHYLRWAYRRITERAAPWVSVTEHRLRAVGLDEDAAGQRVRLAGGREIPGLDAVVLAQGHLPARPDAEQRRLARYAARNGLRYQPPGNPADADLDAVRPGETVLLRGLGLNFFDYLALLTTGRGGSFRAAPDGRLSYRPSGREPRLHAGSRRGVPYHARGDNQKGVAGRHRSVLLGPEVIAALRERPDPVRFRADVWPLVAREVEAVYYGALAAEHGHRDPEALRAALLDCPSGSLQEHALLAGAGIGPDRYWDWGRLLDPCRDLVFAGPAEFRDWLLGHLARDAAEAARGNVRGPLKAALDVLRDLRNEIRLVVDHGGLAGDSYRDELRGWYTPGNAFLSIGPPRRRVAEMAALVEAGVLDLVGPRMTVRPAGEEAGRAAFVAESPLVPGSAVAARTLIEARLPESDVHATADPLLRSLLRAGEAGPYRIATADGGWYDTGGLAVTGRPGRLVDAQGRPHPRRFAFGVPTEGVHWVTAAGIRPGADSVILGDADAIARAALELDPVLAEPETAASVPCGTPSLPEAAA